MATPFVPPASEPTQKKDFDIEQLNCLNTIQLGAYLTVDAICCAPCCCCCGGCCGQYNACVLKKFPNESDKIKPGTERFALTCYIQTMACLLMTNTGCGFCWACCGTCTPCAKCIAKKVMKVESNAMVTTPPSIQMIN